MADLTSAAQRLVEDTIDLPSHFLDVATHDPLFNPVLLLFGVLFVTAPVLAMAYLSAGAVFSLFTVESAPPESRQ